MSRQIIQKVKVTVVLAGMRMVTNLGNDYTACFAAIYPTVARKFELILSPFFLQGVAGDRALNQGDGIHPLAKGYRIVMETVYPYVLQVVTKLIFFKDTSVLTAVETRGAATMEIGEEMQLVYGDT